MVVIGSTELKNELDRLEKYLIDTVDKYESYGDLCSRKDCLECPFFKFRIENMTCGELFAYYKNKHLLKDEEVMGCVIQNHVSTFSNEFCALFQSCEQCKLNKVSNCNTFASVVIKKLKVSIEDFTLEIRVKMLEDKMNELLKEKKEDDSIKIEDLRKMDSVEIDLGDGDNINGIVYFIDKKEHEVVLGRSTVCFSKLNTAVGIRLQQEARISFDDIVSIKLDL